MNDLISRQAAIDAMAELQGSTSSKGVLKGISKAWKRIEQLPPALPEPMKIDLSRCSEENWERIKKEWANTPITTIAAQPYTIIDGRLFITVDDIEQVDCVLVAEYKSKFCREFWMADADEPAQPEPYTDALKAEIKRMKRSFTICINSDYYTGYMSALSAVEGYIAQMEVTT